MTGFVEVVERVEELLLRALLAGDERKGLGVEGRGGRVSGRIPHVLSGGWAHCGRTWSDAASPSGDARYPRLQPSLASFFSVS